MNALEKLKQIADILRHTNPEEVNKKHLEELAIEIEKVRNKILFEKDNNWA